MYLICGVIWRAQVELVRVKRSSFVVTAIELMNLA